jgi:hypothetical protein
LLNGIFKLKLAEEAAHGGEGNHAGEGQSNKGVESHSSSGNETH